MAKAPRPSQGSERATRIEPATHSPLPAEFFNRPALKVARDLLGKSLVRRHADGRLESAIIHETEAYIGPHDKACHAAKGHTPRTAVMFGPAGHWYVYFVYGIHWMLNVVTGDEGYPAAVLLRGAGRWIGPARLTKGLSIDKQFNGQPAAEASGLWIEDRGIVLPRSAVSRTPRIGVDYAAEWAAKPYRFVASGLARQLASNVHATEDRPTQARR